MSYCVDDNEFRERMAETKPGEEQDFVLWVLSAIAYECDSPDAHQGHDEQRRRWAEETSTFLRARGWRD